MPRPGHKPWRLANLYSIKLAATGKVAPFVPRPEQRIILNKLLAGQRRMIILKARRLGISTALGIYCADSAIFEQGQQISIVDKTQTDAQLKLSGIIKVAYESLPAIFRKKARVVENNASSWGVGLSGSHPSMIYAGINSRGGTNQILHVSELGVVQADAPKRAEEVITGAFPSAEHGVIVIETTWKGGRAGALYGIVKQALEVPADQRTPMDWDIVFFPWWVDPGYSEEGPPDIVTPELEEYFAEKEQTLSVRFSPGQRAWYARRRKTFGLFTYREFPTDISECFRAPVEGAIYADLIARLRADGAISHGVLPDSNALVHTAMDLGSPINSVMWYFQLIGNEIRVIDCDLDLDLTPVERVSRMLRKGYLYGCHYLPHDALATQKSGTTFAGDLTELGLANIRVVPQAADIWVGINHLRGMLPRMSFRLPHCEAGIEMLELYHTVRETSTGLAVDVPRHDRSSHAADALRTLSESERAGMLGKLFASAPRGRITTGYRGDDGPAKPDFDPMDLLKPDVRRGVVRR